jgi:predicted metal-dependent phosphotriesterase family hydrolase
MSDPRVLSTVESVTGPLEPDELGVTLPHEHVFINATRSEPRDGYLTVWEQRQADLELFLAAGVRPYGT